MFNRTADYPTAVASNDSVVPFTAEGHGWLGRTVSEMDARDLLVEVADILSVTPWVLDHAIWKLIAKKMGRRRGRLNPKLRSTFDSGRG